MYEIRSDMAIPPARGGRGPVVNSRRGALRDMAVGASVFFADEQGSDGWWRPRGHGEVRFVTHEKGWRFTTRRVTEDGQRGTRIWRVE